MFLAPTPLFGDWQSLFSLRKENGKLAGTLDQGRPMKLLMRTLRIAMLLAAVSLGSACATPVAQENAAAELAQGSKKQEDPSHMPDALIGVWHRSDDDGRRSCDSYRKVGSTIDTDEEPYSLIGSLVVTRGLVHAYAEYGEGNFYAVKHVSYLGNQEWNVDALVYIDTMPTEGESADKDSLRFKIESELLSMNETDVGDGHERSFRFFRCGEVLESLYEDQVDTTR